MSKSRMTISDMEQLAELVRATADPEKRGRWLDWIATAIDVRVAQQTRSGTEAHRELMFAFQAATERWKAAREQACVGYAAEQTEWDATHPRPTLRAFMEGVRQPDPDAPADVCPVCGMAEATDDELEPPDLPVVVG